MESLEKMEENERIRVAIEGYQNKQRQLKEIIRLNDSNVKNQINSNSVKRRESLVYKQRRKDKILK